MALITKDLVQNMFPSSRYTFYGNFIKRYRRALLQNRHPKLDLIMAVDNTEKFHAENLKMNKNHYTYMNRATKCHITHKMHKWTAKVHFNEIEMQSDMIEQVSQGKNSSIKVRYGVISYDDLLRDLKHWETLMVSSFMMRPYHEIVRENCDELDEAINKNLTSALAYAMLITPDRTKERDVFENIVEIPHYERKCLFISQVVFISVEI